MSSKSWNLTDVVKILIILIFLALISHLLKTRFQFLSFSTPFQTVFLMLLVYGLLSFCVIYLVYRKYNQSLADLGFTPFDLKRGFSLAILWLVILRMIIFLYGILAAAIGSFFNLRPPQELVSRIPHLFGYGYVGLSIAIFMTVLIAPLVEELFFRGFIYPALKTRMSVKGAIFSSALIFGLFHLNPWLIIPTGLIGAVLAYLYEVEGSLVPAINLHSLNNLISIIMVYSIYMR